MNLASFLRWSARHFNFRRIPQLLYLTRHLALGREPRFFEVGGLSIFLDPNDYFQSMMFYGRYSPEILDLFDRYIRPGDTVLDIGAQIGYFTLHMSRMVGPHGRVIAFEPDPRARRRLEMSVAANHFSSLSVFPFALSSSEGDMEFFLSPVLGWSTAVTGSRLNDLKPTVVQATTLDRLVRQQQVPASIQFIKVDVEGFEVDAVNGMRQLLTISRPLILLEMNDFMLSCRGQSVSTLTALLHSFGYEEIERLECDVLFAPLNWAFTSKNSTTN